MFKKLPLPSSVRNVLGWALAAGAIGLIILCRRHTLPYEIGFALLFVAYALRPVGSYLFLPAFTVLLAVFLGLSNHTLIIPGIALVLAVLIAFYGWRETKQGKASIKRLG